MSTTWRNSSQNPHQTGRRFFIICALVSATLFASTPGFAQGGDGSYFGGKPQVQTLFNFTYNGFNIDLYLAADDDISSDQTKKLLLGPICAFERDQSTNHLRFRRREGPAGIVFFDLWVVVRDAKVPYKAASDARRISGWNIAPEQVEWMPLTAIVIQPQYADLYGNARAEIGRQGFIHTRDIEVVTFAIRYSYADAFERALVEGHNFLFCYESQYFKPAICRIDIRTKDIRDLGFERDLKGPGDARFVTRDQALEMLNRLTQNLIITRWVDLDVPPDIRNSMVKEAFDNLVGRLWQEREVLMTEFSMEELSKYMIDPNGRDFTADLMKKYAEEFASKDAFALLAKYKDELKYHLKMTNELEQTKKSSGLLNVFKIFGLGGGHTKITNEKSAYDNEEEYLLDIMQEIKSNIERSFKFEKEGDFYIAKSVVLYDIQQISLNYDRVIGDETVIPRYEWRSDPYERNSAQDYWLAGIDDFQSRFRYLLND